MIVSALGVLLYYQQKRLRILEEATKRASIAMVEWPGVDEKVAGWLSGMKMSERRGSRASRDPKLLPELPSRCPQPLVELPGDSSFYWESK